jgi:hypothetical protein
VSFYDLVQLITLQRTDFQFLSTSRDESSSSSETGECADDMGVDSVSSEIAHNSTAPSFIGCDQ